MKLYELDTGERRLNGDRNCSGDLSRGMEIDRIFEDRGRWDMTFVLMFRLMLRSIEPIAGLDAYTYGFILVSTQGGYCHSIFLCKIFLRSFRIISYLCLICSIISFENM